MCLFSCYFKYYLSLIIAKLIIINFYNREFFREFCLRLNLMENLSASCNGILSYFSIFGKLSAIIPLNMLSKCLFLLIFWRISIMQKLVFMMVCHKSNRPSSLVLFCFPFLLLWLGNFICAAIKLINSSVLSSLL